MADEFVKFQEHMDSINNKQMMGPGMYRLSMAQKDNQPAYPWAPTMVSQRGGVSTIEGVSLVDVDSELMNITRINSKDPKMHYQPDENKKVVLKHVQDGGFHQESELLNNPPSLLRGQKKIVGNHYSSTRRQMHSNLLEDSEMIHIYLKLILINLANYFFLIINKKI